MAKTTPGRQWYVANREAALAYRRAYHAKNRERELKARRKHYAKHRNKELAKANAYYAEHKDAIRARRLVRRKVRQVPACSSSRNAQ